MIALLALLAAAPAVTPVAARTADSAVVADSLTMDKIKKMKVVHDQYMAIPDSDQAKLFPRMEAPKIRYAQTVLDAATRDSMRTVAKLRVPPADTVVEPNRLLAAIKASPRLSAVVTKAGLTPEQYAGWRRRMDAAWAVAVYNKAGFTPFILTDINPTESDIAFVEAHEAELKADGFNPPVEPPSPPQDGADAP